jgi:hypothetical protein
VAVAHRFDQGKVLLGSELFKLFEIKTMKESQENCQTKVEYNFGGLT